MCTAISFTTDKHFFGRNLDLNYNYPQTGIFVPRNYKITFKKEDEISNHFALLGVGIYFINKKVIRKGDKYV